jgi:hypothetical protein
MISEPFGKEDMRNQLDLLRYKQNTTGNLNPPTPGGIEPVLHILCCPKRHEGVLP